MSQACKHLESLLNLALAAGCSVEGGWSEAKRVLKLVPSMPGKLKEAAVAVESPVEDYSYAGSPHNAPDEGFYCRQCKVGISFPIPRRI